MRTPFIAGNWKMNKDNVESISLVKELINLVEDAKVDIAVFPAFTSLNVVFETIKNTNIKLGAQNMHYEEEGAFTGEISPLMLKDCEYVILGHSERRHIFNEKDDLINKKIIAALKHNLKPILCIGETLEEREQNATFKIIESQLKNSLLEIKDMKNVTIAYEPVWAIGTGKTATPEQAEEVHVFIRKLLGELYNKEIADSTRILYGGSVKPENIKALMAKENIDGVLVGGASLDAKKFAQIVKF